MTRFDVEAGVALKPLEVAHDVLPERLLVQLGLPVVEISEPVALKQLPERLGAVLVGPEALDDGLQILLGRAIGRSKPKQDGTGSYFQVEPLPVWYK